MIGITALVSVLGVIASLLVRPMAALGVLILSLFLYPEYLRVPLGLVQMSVPRFVATAIVIRFLCSSRRVNFRWRLIDTLVVTEWAWGVFANVAAGSPPEQLNYMIGRFFDTALIYFAARVSFVGKQEWRLLFIPVAICAISIGIVGVAEAITYTSPYQIFAPYMQWGFQFEHELEFRYGFLRAQGSMASPIYFGVAMTLLAGLLWAMRGFCRSTWLWCIAFASAFLGAISSMSSGPQQALAVLVLANVLYYRPGLVKPTLLCLLVFAAVLEIASNRHFYYLIEYINFSGGDYWYRARLLDVAVKNLDEYWMFGCAGKAPNHWGLQIDGRLFVDVVNHYVCVAVNSGLFGVVLLLAIQILSLREVAREWQQSPIPNRKLLFGQAAVIVSLMVSGMSVGLFSGALLMSYLHVGLIFRRTSIQATDEAASAKDGRRRLGNSRASRDSGPTDKLLVA